MEIQLMHQIHPNWKAILKEEFNKEYFLALQNFIADAYQNTTCYPPSELIFNALNSCSPYHIKVVIIGQDPYHGNGQANGLCFSVQEGISFPPSLQNIFKERKQDLGAAIPTTGDLSDWAKQGVLMLNATLTVESGKAASHQNRGWELFTDALIAKINTETQNTVFLLWGAMAQKKAARVDTAKHLVLKSGHPSPLSANRGLWFGNKHFSKTNQWLASKNLPLINW